MLKPSMTDLAQVPLPFSMRRQLFHFLATSEIVAKINYAVRITFIFVAVLFIDAFQRMLKVHSEAAASPDHGLNDLRFENSYHAKKFYAQRNLYLTGFTLFLSLCVGCAACCETDHAGCLRACTRSSSSSSTCRRSSLARCVARSTRIRANPVQSGVANSASGSSKKQNTDMGTSTSRAPPAR